ncbi:MAG: glycosyltransferase [Alphaproteobacteria bacterium]|nr:glycosyltransferase [Alphaproteobacteria bacterium]
MNRSAIHGLVGHPGSNHLAYQLVAALQSAGFDVGFETGVFWTGRGVLPKLTAMLPGRIRASAERELKRRSHPGVDPARVRLQPVPELMYIAATRLRLSAERQLAAIAWRNDVFDAQFAQRVLAERPRFTIGHDSSALAAQRATQSYGGLAILNQVIGHIEAGLSIFAEEARRAPEFAETLPLPPARVIAQCGVEAREADRVIVPSDYVRDTMIANGTDPARIFVLPYGVDTGRFRPPSAPRAGDGKFRVLFVGGLTQRKGIKYLLEAAKRADIPGLELVCVGKMAGDASAFSPYARIFRHVRHVPFHEVHRLFQTADVFAYPSLHEGSAFASYEALASGLPVVCTPNTGSVVRDGTEGFLVPPRDVDALVERLRVLARDPDLRARMAKAARARAEEFTWMHYGNRLAGWLDTQLGLKS